MTPDEYVSLDATGVADLIESGQVLASEVAECASNVIAQRNPHVRAVVGTFTAPIGASGSAGGPFRGVPTLVKDLGSAMPGQVQEMGSRMAIGHRANGSSVFMERFIVTGVVVLGRSAVSELGILPTTETVVNGPTTSPMLAGQSAGGSSGGAAASVAAGMVPIAHASDGGGSIRTPAACCGVVGLKPSRGRVTASPDALEHSLGWVSEFVITRSVRDAATMLDAVSGPALGDPYAIETPAGGFLAGLGAVSEPLRIALCSQPWSGAAENPDAALAVRIAGYALEQLGHRVTYGSPSVPWGLLCDVVLDFWSAAVANGVDGLTALTGRIPSPETLEPITLAMYEHGRGLSASDLLQALDGANTVVRAVAPFFSGVDVLVTPTLPGAPLALGAFDVEYGLDPHEIVPLTARHEEFTMLFNVTGQPAISLPLHVSAAGAPIGVQFIARPGDEMTLLRVSRALEEALPWTIASTFERSLLTVKHGSSRIE